MQLSFSPAEEAFRQEVRAWLDTAMPARIRAQAEVDAYFDHADVMAWHRILFEKGWVAPHWPARFGGPGLDPARRFILAEALELAGAPMLSPFGLSMVGPLLMQFGTPEQQARFLPRILSGEEVWCQGYSEPGAGSDLAAVRTSAVDDGDGHFVVTGQKTWTSHAQHADWIFCLVRTDPAAKKQQGISFLLIDLRSPGVTVRPMLTLGGTPAFAETFLDGVRVPKENLVGPLHGGWTLAKALLGHERTMVAQVGVSRRALRRVKALARETLLDGRPLIEDPVWRARIARHEVRLTSLEWANYRALAGAALGHAPGPESSILKLRGSEVLQELFELAMEILGLDGLAWFADPGAVPPRARWVASAMCYYRATTIYAGTSEIQKNIIARMILGLG